VTLNRDTWGHISDLRRLDACWPISLKLSMFGWTNPSNDLSKRNIF